MIGKTFNLPTVIGTSREDGPNGPLMPFIEEILPEATIVRREGEIDAWDSPEFVQAVEATGRKKLIIAGVSTDVCLTFVSLSAKAAGYEVYAVIDSSGTFTPLM